MSLETNDLTSLSWLHNLNIMDNLSSVSGTAPPTPPASPLPDHLLGMMGMTTGGSSSFGRGISHHMRDNGGGRYTNVKRPSSSTSTSSQFSSTSSLMTSTAVIIKEEEKEIDYKTVGDIKPPYSYASLICMAMKTNQHKMTLSSIYKWIKENFLYYRNADPSWQVNF